MNECERYTFGELLAGVRTPESTTEALHNLTAGGFTIEGIECYERELDQFVRSGTQVRS